MSAGGTKIPNQLRGLQGFARATFFNGDVAFGSSQSSRENVSDGGGGWATWKVVRVLKIEEVAFGGSMELGEGLIMGD